MTYSFPHHLLQVFYLLLLSKKMSLAEPFPAITGSVLYPSRESLKNGTVQKKLVLTPSVTPFFVAQDHI